MSQVLTPPSRAASESFSLDESSIDERWIAQAIRVCEQAAQGDFEPRVLHCDTRTPAGRLGRAINDLLDRADAFVRESAATLENASQDKFYRRLLPNGMVGAYRRAADVINAATAAMAAKSKAIAEHERRRHALADEVESHLGGIVAKLAESAMSLRISAQQLAALSQDTTRAASDGLSAAGTVAQNVQYVGTASDALMKSGHVIEQRVHRSHEVAGNAVQESSRTAVLMQQLSAANQRIIDVVSLIAGIARQTNLLSLNASIEAARAGDAGRGFAVVAQEVKKLAEETAGATKRITKEVASVQVASRDTAQSMSAIETTIQQMNALAEEINAAVHQQITMTSDIQLRLRETDACVGQAATSISQTGDAAERTSDTAAGLLGAADLVTEQTSALHAAVQTLLGHVRGT